VVVVVLSILRTVILYSLPALWASDCADSATVIFFILLWIGESKFYYKTRQYVTK